MSDAGPFGSGVSEVWVAVSSGGSEGVWWNQADGLFTQSQGTIHWATMVYTGGVSWSTAPTSWVSAAFTDGASYRMHVKAKDAAGNWVNDQTNPALSTISQYFKYDTSRPTGTVSVPVNSTNSAAGLLASGFSGSSADPNGGVKVVYLAVEKVDGPQAGSGFWNWGAKTYSIAAGSLGIPPGAGWTQVSSTTLYDQFTLGWSTPAPNELGTEMLLSSNTYRLAVAVVDQANNTTLNPAAAGAGSTFHYDTQVPTATITSPGYNLHYNLASLGQMLGTANDEATGASGLKNVQVLLKSKQIGGGGAGAGYWNGGSTNDFADWDTGAGTKYSQWRLATGLASWSLAFPTINFLDSTRFVLWVRARDKSDNLSVVPSNGQLDTDLKADGNPALSFTFDNTQP
ncbi:MAG: hypothetical protein FD129_1809, partial [bacterium]